jgi:phospholipid/cholesterol/gamma-HCH transport system permease protein
MFRALWHVGRYVLLLKQTFSSFEKGSVYWSLTMREILNIGIGSIPIVFLISTFIGAVTTVQTAYQLVSALLPKSTIGSVVSASALLEMAPTVMSIVLAGKVGSSISSEIGTMRVTEQIDALEVMGINATSYLILPKILASIFAFPCLVIISAFLMHVGGFTAGGLTGEVTYQEFANGIREWFDPFQVRFMLYKSVTFGFIISTISSYTGFYVKGGALEVGQAATTGVVYSCIFIIIADYVLAQILI